MTGELARRFHDRTAHTWRSVRTAGPRFDPSTRPPAVKPYPDLAPIPLPVGLAETDWPALDALSGEPPPNGRPFDLARLAALLFCTAGVTRRWESDGRARHFRAASSAGALYPIETYVVVRDLADELPAGVYHFDPVGYALRRLRAGDHRGVLARAAVADDVADAPATVVLTGVPWRTMWKYGPRGYRHLFWDAGTMLANLLTVATAAAEPARVLTGFVDAEVSHLLGLDAGEEVPLAVVPIGGPDAAPAPTVDRPDDLLHRSAPLGSGASVRDVLEVHRAGDLPGAAAVVAWRAGMEEVQLEPTARPGAAPLVAAYDTTDEVILRRGSTRRFARAEVPAAALAWPLSVAARPVPCDALAPGGTFLRHHVLVHAVAGVPSGLHRWRPEGLELIRPGPVRGEAAQLCLEQPLGGDGAYTVLHTADLRRVLERGGERAYRAVQLEGGIALGRAQLAAFTVGLGATGLTFYDDDVTRFVGAPDEPVCVTSVGVPAYQGRPGRRPSDARR